MTHLVIGASGQVGAALVRELKRKDWDVVGTFYSHPDTGTARHFLDISDRAAVDRFIHRVDPIRVWLPAAFTIVDAAGTADEVNLDGVKNVVDAAEKRGTAVIFYSSGYVFDGKSDRPYTTDDPTNPINAYGRQKVCAENIVKHHSNNVIIRTVGVYGHDYARKNFAYRVLDAVSSKESIHVPGDQWMNPIITDDLAELSINLVCLLVRGTIHIAGDTPVTKYQFACDLVKAARLDPKYVIPMSSEELEQASPRPKFCVLDHNEIGKWGERVQPYGESIRQFIHIWKNKK